MDRDMEDINEKKRAAVLGECEMIEKHGSHNSEILIWTRKRKGKFQVCFNNAWNFDIFFDQSDHHTPETYWDEIALFYRLLGLEARDAVAALRQSVENRNTKLIEVTTALNIERAKVAELEKQNRKLQWLLDGEISAGEQRTAMQIIPMMREAAKDELIGKLQAQSAALVDALEEIKNDTHLRGDENYQDMACRMAMVATKALEAHKKGSVQG